MASNLPDLDAQPSTSQGTTARKSLGKIFDIFDDSETSSADESIRNFYVLYYRPWRHILDESFLFPDNFLAPLYIIQLKANHQTYSVIYFPSLLISLNHYVVHNM